MAVYKPSNCVPFLSCWDLTQNQYISCEINTSNEPVTGYKIRILDNDNNIIYEGKKFSAIPQRVNVTTKTQNYTVQNTCLNGSTLVLPLIVTDIPKDSNDYKDNIIYYHKGIATWISAYGHVNNFSNISANQPYKWQIVLAQGQTVTDEGLTQEPNSKYFDMVIDEAKILGSTGNRIQSWLSENIYKDYYIQLYNANNEQLGVRTRISSYDHSYGFIYPQENTIPQELVDSASYFKIFKDTNDPQYVSTARLVNYRLKTDIDNVVLGGKLPKDKFHLIGDTTTVANPYFAQVYEGDVTGDITYKKYGGASDSSLAQGTTILLMYQGDTNAEPNPTYNVNNGVFAFQSAEFKDGKTTIKWLRPANFNKYADFLNRLICVQSENSNYSTSATAENLGTINKTELMFYEETAIGLYPVYEGETKALKVAKVTLPNSEIGKPQDFNGGIISSVKVETQPTGVTLTAISLGGNKYVIKATPQDTYTGSVIVNITYMEDKGEVFKNAAGKAYIRPFIGIHAGDKLFYGDNFQNNVTIKYIDNEPNSVNKYNPTWYITYDGDKIFSVDEKYSIRSFFKTSDENPFYGKKSPELIIDSDQWSEEGGEYEVQNGYKICTKRYITVRGTFENRNWVNYRWVLTDLTAGYIQQSEKIYRGSTEYTFYGLENEHYYLIQWVVEDEYGVVWTTDDEKNIFMTRVIINATPFPFKATYECETQSVLLNFIRDGVVIPNPSNITTSYYYVYQEDSEGNKIENLERIPYKVQIENRAANSSVFYAVQNKIEYKPDPAEGNEKYYYLQIPNLDPEKEFPADRKALMEYTQTKLEESASEKGAISAPLSNEFIINSEHILNDNFCGDIIDYYIDTDDVNEQPSYIRLTLSLLPAWHTNDNGEVVAEENRNKVVLTVSKKIGNVEPAKTTILPSVYKQDKNGKWSKEKSEGRWQEDKKIVSAFVENTSSLDANLEYIETTHPYVWDDKSGQVQDKSCTNINEDGALNSATKEISFPIYSTDEITGETSTADATSKSGKFSNIWTDKKLKLINQTKSGNFLNVITNDDNKWRDTDENKTPYHWKDYVVVKDEKKSYLYPQTLTTENTGRQNVGKYKMTFSILVKDSNNPTSNINTILSKNIEAVVFISDISKKVGD